jgi:hypothetical protein
MVLFFWCSAVGVASDMILAMGTESVKPAMAGESAISPRLEKAIVELQALHEILLFGEGLDVRILTDFRDALNRVRNTAWSAQQYMLSKATNEDSGSVLSTLAGERLRAAYQLCQTVQADLQSQDVKFQTGQLMELHSATKALTEELAELLGKLK